jgi:hypothetical protein
VPVTLVLCGTLKQYAAQFQLEPVHLAVVCFVIVAAQVQNTVYQKLLDLALDWVSGGFGLPDRRVDRNHNVTQVLLIALARHFVAGWKREHVGRPVDLPILFIQASNDAIANKNNGDARI